MMIVFFGRHEIIDQWAMILKNEVGFAFCPSYKELFSYPTSNTTVIYVRIPNKASLKIALKLKFKGYKICKWWAGTDCRHLKDAHFLEKLLSKIIYRFCIYRNFSSASWLSETLNSCGITTHYLHTSTPVFLLNEQLKLKDAANHSHQLPTHALIYSNPNRHWIYNTKMMLELANQMPSIQFIFVGDNSINDTGIANVTSLGRISQDKLFSLYSSQPVLIRITSHDSLARMVIEAMYFGLHVITNWPVPHTHTKHTIEGIKQVLTSKLTFNQQGYDYVREELNLEKWKKTLLTLVK